MKEEKNVYPKIKTFMRKNVSLEITIYVIKTSKTFILWSTFIFVLCLNYILIRSLPNSYVFSHLLPFDKCHTLFKCNSMVMELKPYIEFFMF